jgi:hypothetical protein
LWIFIKFGIKIVPVKAIISLYHFISYQ